MSCPHCENTEPHTSSPNNQCPHCASERKHAEDNNKNDASTNKTQSNTVREATDVEIIPPEQAQEKYGHGQRSEHTTNTTNGERINFWNFTQGGSFQGNVFQGAGAFRRQKNTASCLPSLILLATAIGLAIQFDFFAGLGFLFFYALGSVISMVFFVRRALQGKGEPVTFVMRRAIVWLLSFLLTVFLSS